MLRTCQVRAGVELSSERRGVLQAGQQIAVLEQRDEGGVVRVRLDRGWVSVTTKGGVTVLERVEQAGEAEPAGGGGVPDNLKDESARGEPYVAKSVRFLRATAAVDLAAAPGEAAEPSAGSLEEGAVAEVEKSRIVAGAPWVLLTTGNSTGWAAESVSLPDDAEAAAAAEPQFEVVLPMPMQSWQVLWSEIPEAPFASLEEEPRDPVFYACPRPDPSDLELEPADGDGGAAGVAKEEEFEMDDADLHEDGVWLFAEATAVAEVTFPPKTLFLLDMLKSPGLGGNRDVETVRARRRALSAWLQAVHRLEPANDDLLQFFAPPEDDSAVALFFQFGRPIARSEDGSEYVVYTIKCTGDGEREWTVHKRFSEFSQLRDVLLKQEEDASGGDGSKTAAATAAGDERGEISSSSSSSNSSRRGEGDVGSPSVFRTPRRVLSEALAAATGGGPSISSSSSSPDKKIYTCVMGAVVRGGFEMDSPRCGVLRKGNDIVGLEEHTTDDGVNRVRFDGGWVSCTASNGEKILEEATGLWRSSSVASSSFASSTDGQESSEDGDDTDEGESEDGEKQQQTQSPGVAAAQKVVTITVESSDASSDKDAPTKYTIRYVRPSGDDGDDDLSAPSGGDAGNGGSSGSYVEVSKRFSDFAQLRTLLIETESAGRTVSTLDFPSKIQLNLFKRTEEVAEERRLELEVWLNGVLEICGTNEDLKEFMMLSEKEKEKAKAQDEEEEEADGNRIDSPEEKNDDESAAAADEEQICGTVWRCKVRSVVRSDFAVDSRRSGVLEAEQVIRALAGRRNAKSVLRIKYDGGWVSETDGSSQGRGGTPLLVKVAQQKNTTTATPSRQRHTRGPPQRRFRTYRCVSATIATEGPLLDTPTCAQINAGDIVKASEAMRDRNGNRRLRCEGKGWVSETDPLTKETLLTLVQPPAGTEAEAGQPESGVGKAVAEADVAVTVAAPSTTVASKRYRSLLRGVVREGSAVDSEKTSTILGKNRVIHVVEEITLPTGQIRVRFDEGWVSVSDSAGRKIIALLVDGEEEE